MQLHQVIFNCSETFRVIHQKKTRILRKQSQNNKLCDHKHKSLFTLTIQNVINIELFGYFLKKVIFDRSMLALNLSII